MKRINLTFGRLAVVVVALAVAGAGSATAASLIDSGDIKNRGIKGVDIKKRTLGASHLTAKARAALKGNAGPQGIQGPKGDPGPKGDKGDQGPKGDRGPSNAYVVSDTEEVLTDQTPGRVLTQGSLPTGQYVVQANFTAIASEASGLECFLRTKALENLDRFAVKLAADTPVAVNMAGILTVPENPGLLLDEVRIHCTTPETGTLTLQEATLVTIATAQGVQTTED